MLWWGDFLKVELFSFLMAINFKWFRTDSGVTKKYVSAGKALGFAISLLAYGESIDMQKRIARLVGWEGEYVGRGFRTISIDDFTQAAGWKENIADLVGVKREEGEEPIFHAQEYQENYRTPPAWGGVEAAFKTGEQQYRTNPNS